MTKRDRLRAEARKAATWRGHKLSPFNLDDYAICLNPGCTAQVMIETNPAPNSTDIAGRAVAMNCPCR